MANNRPKGTCSDCVWNSVNDVLPHCLHVQNSGDNTCDKFYLLTDYIKHGDHDEEVEPDCSCETTVIANRGCQCGAKIK